MSLYNEIIAVYPELSSTDFEPKIGKINLQNDGDGDYIVKWEYEKPIPAGLKLGK